MRHAALTLLLATTAVSAQTDWRPVPSGSSFSVDALYALGDDIATQLIGEQGQILGNEQIDVTSSVLLLAGRVPVGPRWTVLAELPVGYARYAGPLPGGEAYSESDAMLGNPFVGVEAGLGAGWTLGAGVRVPLYSYNVPNTFGWQGGVTADRERFEAYIPDVLTVSASAGYAVAIGPSFRVNGRLAPALLTDVSGADNYNGPDKTGVVLGYGLRAERDLGAVTLHGGVVGRPVLSGQRFEVFDAPGTAVLGGVVDVRGVRPGVLVRVPLSGSDYTTTDATVGLTLDVPFR